MMMFFLNDKDQIVETTGHFEAGLAPDYLHKDNVSGGSPYAVKLPDPGVDFLFRNDLAGGDYFLDDIHPRGRVGRDDLRLFSGFPD